MSRLFVLVTGFGEPYWDHKVSILTENLRKITEYPWDHLHVRVCQYENPESQKHRIPEELVSKYNLEVLYSPGIVGDFIRLHGNPRDLQGYTHVLLLLDDVEIISVDFEQALAYQRDLSLDLLSLSMTRDSKCVNPYMLQQPNVGLRVTTACEYFWYLFPMSGYVKYYPHVYPDNPWMWGLDLVLHKHLKLNVGILGRMTMRHWYSGTSYSRRPDKDPWVGFQNCLTRFSESRESLANQTLLRFSISYM